MGLIWYNIQREKLPPPDRQLLISVNGVDYTATYDPERKLFITGTDADEVTFSLNSGTIYWAELDEAGAA
jgi:hypothetical protein